MAPPPVLLQVLRRTFAMFHAPEAARLLAVDAELHAYLLRHPVLFARRQREAEGIVGLVERAVAQAQAQGTLDPDLDPRLTAAALTALHDGTKTVMALGGASFDIDAYEQTIIQLLRLDGTQAR